MDLALAASQEDLSQEASLAEPCLVVPCLVPFLEVDRVGPPAAFHVPVALLASSQGDLSQEASLMFNRITSEGCNDDEISRKPTSWTSWWHPWWSAA